jgi:hypothetical protein
MELNDLPDLACDVIKKYQDAKAYNMTLFNAELKEIFSDPSDPEKNHARADDLMVQMLEMEHYDCTPFKESETWCA